VSIGKKERQISAFREHEAILQAVIDKDTKLAEELVKKHLQGALEAYLSAFAEERAKT